jgi:hypothetical protein
VSLAVSSITRASAVRSSPSNLVLLTCHSESFFPSCSDRFPLPSALLRAGGEQASPDYSSHGWGQMDAMYRSIRRQIQMKWACLVKVSVPPLRLDAQATPQLWLISPLRQWHRRPGVSHQASPPAAEPRVASVGCHGRCQVGKNNITQQFHLNSNWTGRQAGRLAGK